MARVAGGRSFISIPDVTVGAAATLLRAADEARVGLVLTNNHASVAVRVGDAAVTATRGVRLSAGASMTCTATPAIYAISEGADVGVSLSEELA